jgi:hypothetical protein
MLRTKMKLVVVLLIFAAPAVWGLWFAENWVWNTIPQSYRWMFVWIQVVLGGVGIGYLCYHQVIIPTIERIRQKRQQVEIQINQRKLQAEIEAYQKVYGDSREKTCLYATAAGSVAKLIWSNIEKFDEQLLNQALKICCLVPDDAIFNAEASVQRCLDRYGALTPPPVLIKPVSSGKLHQAGADAARKAELPEVKKAFMEWGTESLKKVKVISQFVGISHGNSERPGYTAKSCFEKYPFIGLRKEIGDKVTGEIPRWVTLVLDMEVPVKLDDKNEVVQTGLNGKNNADLKRDGFAFGIDDTFDSESGTEPFDASSRN